MMPRVSVIIPTFNHARYLSQALQSILGQSYQDWEALIIDDGSTDDTPSVVDQYTDPRLRYVHQTNQGLAAARNAGVRAASGDYLGFLDADDAWSPTFIECCLGALGAQIGWAGVYTGHYFMDQDDAVLPQAIRPEVLDPETFRARLLEGGFFPPCSVMLRSQVVHDSGAFDTQLQGMGAEDWDLWLRITDQHIMHALPKALAYYRVSSGSMSSNVASMHACRLSVLTKRFGAPTGDPQDWPPAKRRAYGFAYRTTAVENLIQQRTDVAWGYIAKAVDTYPFLLERLDTLYELACGSQPRAYRGQANLLDIEANTTELLMRLDASFAGPWGTFVTRRRVVYGNAYLALSMLHDQAGQWARARHYLIKSIYAHPAQLGSPVLLRRLLKLVVGKRIVVMLRRTLNPALSIGIPIRHNLRVF